MNQEKINQLEQENQQLKNKINQYETSKQKSRKRKFWLTKKAITFFIGIGLKQSLVNALNEFTENKKLSKDTIADVTSHVIWRLTRIGLFAFIISLLPTLLLFQQNKLFIKQNAKIETQNRMIEQQTHLAEGARRSTQMFIMGEVLSDVYKEIGVIEGKQKMTNDSVRRNLSLALQARIISLSKAMKPYKYLDIETDSLSVASSPERGQLLTSLLISGTNLSSENNIFKYSDFSYSELESIPIDSVSFRNIKLNNSIINSCSFKKGSFYDSNLREVTLTDCSFEELDFFQTSLNYSKLKNVSFINNNLEAVSFNNSDLTNCFFNESELSNLKFYKANLSNVSFRKSTLDRVTFFGCTFDKLDLRETSLSGVKFFGVISIDSTLVDRKDWLKYIKDDLKLSGAEQLNKRYKVKTIHKDSLNSKFKKINDFNTFYYMIVPKKSDIQ